VFKEVARLLTHRISDDTVSNNKCTYVITIVNAKVNIGSCFLEVIYYLFFYFDVRSSDAIASSSLIKLYNSYDFYLSYTCNIFWYILSYFWMYAYAFCHLQI